MLDSERLVGKPELMTGPALISEWPVIRPHPGAGTGHGIVVRFDADLVEGVGFSTAPGAPETVYGCLFNCTLVVARLLVGTSDAGV